MDCNSVNNNEWVLILAGGDGTRLRQLATRDGQAVPKQYCSLAGGQTLLDDAIARSQRVVPKERICVIVSEPHRRWWSALLKDLSKDNVIVQPRNHGTGIGLLYATLHITARDPDAVMLALPADHFVGDEETLGRSLRAALDSAGRDPEHVMLLGIEPDRIDSELGYIAPGPSVRSGVRRVQEFVEKPDEVTAARLIQRGALWNTFILAAAVRAMANLFFPRYAFAALEMQTVALSSSGKRRDRAAVVDLYERLPVVDFSHDVLATCRDELRLLHLPKCGWNDLGTPRRVAQTLRSLPFEHPSRQGRAPFINLAAQHALHASDL
jgi:mannose-1-phosphate guanylyltransferase